MRVLVTGVTGFIGNALSKALISLGHKVYGLVRFTSNPANVPPGVNVIQGDLTDYYSIERVVSCVRPEVVFHLAALTPVSLSFFEPEAYADVNYLGTVRLLEALRRRARECIRMVAIAGTTEMFDTSKPISEDTRFNPSSPYAISKVAAVYYAVYMYRAYRMPTVVAIPCNTYGRANVRQSHFVIEKIITSMLRGDATIYMGNPHPKRDFMFREDHVNAYLSLMKAVVDEGKEHLLGSWIVFGTGKAYTIKHVFEICREIIGWNGRVVWGLGKRPLDPPVMVTNPVKAEKELGWKAKYDIQSGISKAVEEWRQVLEG